MYIVPEEKYIAKGYWQPYSLGEELHRSAERHAERIAVVSGGRRVTYRELDRLVDEYAAGMIELGIRPGDRVLLQPAGVRAGGFRAVPLRRHPHHGASGEP